MGRRLFGNDRTYVSIFILTKPQCDSFEEQGSTSPSLDSPVNVASGKYAAPLEGPGDYYIVILHGTGSEQTSQTVKIDYTFEGSNPTIVTRSLIVLLHEFACEYVGS